LACVTRISDGAAHLHRIREFERTFEQIYGRKMTPDELRILSAARKIIEQKLAEYSEKVG
jgi:hypothetical protein